MAFLSELVLGWILTLVSSSNNLECFAEAIGYTKGCLGLPLETIDSSCNFLQHLFERRGAVGNEKWVHSRKNYILAGSESEVSVLVQYTLELQMLVDFIEVAKGDEYT